MTRSLLFDAVFFDLDGTLVATDKFWVESADRGARRAFRQLGLERPLPTPGQWLNLVGMPLEVGFRALFSDLSAASCQVVLQACVEEEVALLRRGGAPAMQDARETVRLIHEQGLKVGIASNCQQSYLDHMLDALELRAFVTESCCRETPGIDSKGDMLARLLLHFGTRSAVMVGDRSSDRDAAWENGIPHVHCAFGFAQGDESVEAEGRIASLRELSDLLRRRAQWIERSLQHVGAFGRPGLRLGITGGPAAGKTLFARDAARLLREQGQPAVALSLTELAPQALEPHGGDPLGDSVDLARLQRELLLPHERGEIVSLRAPDLLGQHQVPAGAVLVLEGPYLLGAKLRTGLDRLIHLDLSEAVLRRRLQGRARRAGSPGTPDVSSEQAQRDQRWLEQRFPPQASADLVLDGTNPLGSG